MFRKLNNIFKGKKISVSQKKKISAEEPAELSDFKKINIAKGRVRDIGREASEILKMIESVQNDECLSDPDKFDISPSIIGKANRIMQQAQELDQQSQSSFSDSPNLLNNLNNNRSDLFELLNRLSLKTLESMKAKSGDLNVNPDLFARLVEKKEREEGNSLLNIMKSFAPEDFCSPEQNILQKAINKLEDIEKEINEIFNVLGNFKNDERLNVIDGRLIQNSHSQANAIITEFTRYKEGRRKANAGMSEKVYDALKTTIKFRDKVESMYNELIDQMGELSEAGLNLLTERFASGDIQIPEFVSDLQRQRMTQTQQQASKFYTPIFQYPEEEQKVGVKKSQFN